MFTQEEISKLPKWAQNKANKIQSDIEHWKSKAKQVEGEQETNVFINYYPTPQPLPKDSDIKFKLSAGEISFRVVRDSIEVHATSYSGRLAILPQVSNGILLSLIKD